MKLFIVLTKEGNRNSHLYLIRNKNIDTWKQRIKRNGFPNDMETKIHGIILFLKMIDI